MPRRPNRTRIATAALLGLCGIFGCIAMWEALSVRNSAHADAAAVAAVDQRELPEAPVVSVFLPSKRVSLAMVDRPLFMATRRPPPKIERHAAPAKPVPRPDLSLVGTIVTDEERHGLLWDKRKNEFTRVAPGAKVQGWEVREINNNEVIVWQQKQSHTYTLPRF